MPGDNIVIIGCFNKQWDGPGGQSSYDFRINTGPPGGTLQEYWSAKNAALDANGENVRKVVFAKTILVRVGEDGDVTLSQKIERSLRDRVKLAVSELEKAILKNGDDIVKAWPEWVEFVGNVIAYIATSSPRK